MKTTTKTLIIHFAFIFFFVSACRAHIARNDDGSLTLQTTISEQELQAAITASIADPLIKDLTVSLQSGYILVTGERQRLNDATKTDTLTFRLDLGGGNGQLTTTVSEAQLEGIPVDQNRVDHWNQTIASRLAILGKKNPNGSLQAVSIAPEAVHMNWDISR